MRAKSGLEEPGVEDLTNFASQETLDIQPGGLVSLDEEVQGIDFDLFNAKDFL